MNPMVITEVNDSVIEQLMKNGNTKVDIRPIYQAAKMKKGEDKQNAMLDIQLVLALAHNSLCERGERFRMWVSMVLGSGIAMTSTLTAVMISHLVH